MMGADSMVSATHQDAPEMLPRLWEPDLPAKME